MAYQVIKRVGGRAYRYEVYSYRDPGTKRARGKWRYLGKVNHTELPDLAPQKPPPRDRLVARMIQAIEERDADMLTSRQIAKSAGVGYGTFYTYFKNIRELIRAAWDVMDSRSAASEEHT